MYYIDVKYINLLSPKLEKFTWKKSNLAICRCPICGDSKKNKSKKRFYIYDSKGKYFVKCHNCQYACSFSKFLESQDSHLYSEYRLENYRSANTTQVLQPASVSQEKEPEEKNHWKEILEDYETLDNLDSSNPGVQYAKKRMIPKSRFSDIYYLNNFTEFCSKFDTKVDNFPRLGFCFRKSNGDVCGMNCRVIDSSMSSVRYITFKDEEEVKVFGMNQVNLAKPVYIVEGPIDSLFLKNCIAMMGSSADIRTLGIKEAIYVFDNEPRNRDICRQIKGKIDAGHKVVIWPDYITLKDINDMVVAGLDVETLIEQSTYSGLLAVAKFTQWRKV